MRSLYLLSTALLLIPQIAAAQQADVKIYTLDCGDIVSLDLNYMDQTDSYTEKTKALKGSCYVIKHGDEYMLWDAGLPADLIGKKPEPKEGDKFSPALEKSIADQLTTIGITPADIKKVGISHAHFDHTGQLPSFTDAQLLIGAKDYDWVFSKEPPMGVDAHWFDAWANNKNVVKTTDDYDVFSDGSVVMLSTPGHTPGHNVLLVHLKNTGPVILSGDLAHFKENYAHDRFPDFNTSAEETKQSFKKVNDKIAEARARFIIQHDPEDFASMPKLPAYLD